MTVACLHCQTAVPEVATFCPACGQELEPTAPPAVLRSKLLAALSYFTFIPALVFIFKLSFRRDRFLRFHSFQSLFFNLVMLGIGALLRLIFAVFVLIPHLGFLIAWLIIAVVVLACVMLWLVLVIKALQGQVFSLPGIGPIAERRAAA